MAAKSFLRVVHKSIIFSDLVKALVYIDSTMERRREYLVVSWYRCSLLVENPT